MKSVFSRELHRLADASRLGYACAVYIRVVYTDGTISTALVYSKTKVAPLKSITIPKLELSGTLLLARTLTHVAEQLELSVMEAHVWTDSAIVLNWLETTPGTLKTFESNRVSQIVSLRPCTRWHHVPSKANPADLASRGVAPSRLIAFDLWWNGPPWLSKSPHLWPELTLKPVKILPEIRPVTMSFLVPNEDITLTNSSYHRMLRILAWVIRFFDNVKLPPSKRNLTVYLSAVEMNTAEVNVIKLHQQLYFTSEFNTLRKNFAITKRSRLYHLQPALDEHRLIVVGGRLEHAPILALHKHPRIILGITHLGRIIVRFYHISNHHTGATTLLSVLSGHFYITSVRRTVRAVTTACVFCRKLFARAVQQKMGQLPKERVTPSPPFTTTDIDFAGPFYTKSGAVRKPTLTLLFSSASQQEPYTNRHVSRGLFSSSEAVCV